MTSGEDAAARVRVSGGRAFVAEYPPGARFGPRTLHRHELVWILKGSARWQWGERTISLRPGQLLLIRQGMRDSFLWDPERQTRHAFAHFDLLEGEDRLGPPDRWPLVRSLTHGGPLAELCEYLLWLPASGSSDAGRLGEDVVSLLLTLFVRGPLPGEAGTLPSLPVPVQRAVEHVVGRWSVSGPRAVGLDELASAASVTPGHLSRLFRARFGMGAVSAFERLRLAEAAVLLLRSNLSVQEVSSSCGYANPYHFSRRFRQSYGAPPRAFRARPTQEPGTPLVEAGLQPLFAAVMESPRSAAPPPRHDIAASPRGRAHHG